MIMAKSRNGHRREQSCSEDEEEDVVWKEHEEILSEIFFRPKDFIQRGSEEYKDFWRFLERYEAFRKRTQSARNEKKCSSSSKTSQLGVPMTYDKRYKINVSILTSDVIEEQRSKHGRERRRSRSTPGSLNSKRVAEFRSILLYYIDFCQKQKFNKIVKLKKDQSNLPISHFREQIVEAVKVHQVVIIAGDTGCGKSTQVPQYLLNAGFTQIACTQPRRIACISLAKRVGYETLKEYGSDVAYQIRFEASKTKATRILFLTEGLLLRQLSSDPDLSQHNVIIVDEVHERHLHGDFLLGMLRYLIEGRADLKIVLMSATININLFAGYLEGAPVIQVPGRLYPIQVQYHPPSVEKEKPTSRAERLDPSPYLRIMQLIDKKYPPTERGDLLMFLSGMAEIAAVVDAAKEYAQKTQRWIILPLHSSLSVEEQDKVFDIAPDGVRKCVVSTNIAETSITIDGIRFIVDSGKVKEMNFDPQEKMQRLKEFWISQASAEQRKGRAGRTGPGVCFRLYSENDYHAFSQYATPEIQRTSLDTTILQMVALGINDVRAFAFIEPPPPSSIENSMYFLKQQGALTEEECLTPIGLMLSRLPVDVVIGKMLLMGSVFHLTDPVMVIAAGLNVQSPFTRRLDHDPDVTSRREELESDHGDLFTLLNAYDEWIKVKGREGYQSRKWCKRRGLEQQRFYEMAKLKNQFEDLLHDHGLVEREEKDESDEDEIEKEKFKRRQLKRMKQDHHKSTRRRKLLKLDEDENEADETEPGNDIRDLEFKLTHDLDKLQEDSSARRNFTLRDINLLKIILCSGLYPNLAVPDETNSLKRDSEQTFHTKSKQYLLLHPTSVFATQPDILQTQEARDFHQAHAQTRDIFSGSHQLLAYVSLLETNKPYLVNVMRVPGLQTLLLFARSLDTNADLTRVIADAWLEVRFADVTSAQKGLSAVLQLRGTWARLLELKLDRKSRMINTDGLRAGERNRCRDLERLLALKLSEFLDSDIRYSITRLLSSEEKHLYIGPDNPRNMHGHLNEALPLKGSSTSLNVHPIKGGIQINEYLTYNCLQDEIMAEASSDAAQFIQKHWKCEKCGVKMVVTVLERLQHENHCHGNSESDVDFTLNAADAVTAAESSSNLSSVEHLKKCYFCVECSKEYSFTSTEILKHRRTHR